MQDQQIAKGRNLLSQLQTENYAWHTAFRNTTTSELGDQQGVIGYAKYSGRFDRVIPPGREEDIICQTPPQSRRSSLHCCY